MEFENIPLPFSPLFFFSLPGIKLTFSILLPFFSPPFPGEVVRGINCLRPPYPLCPRRRLQQGDLRLFLSFFFAPWFGERLPDKKAFPFFSPFSEGKARVLLGLFFFFFFFFFFTATEAGGEPPFSPYPFLAMDG